MVSNTQCGIHIGRTIIVVGRAGLSVRTIFFVRVALLTQGSSIPEFFLPAHPAVLFEQLLVGLQRQLHRCTCTAPGTLLAENTRGAGRWDVRWSDNGVNRRTCIVWHRKIGCVF